MKGIEGRDRQGQWQGEEWDLSWLWGDVCWPALGTNWLLASGAVARGQVREDLEDQQYLWGCMVRSLAAGEGGDSPACFQHDFGPEGPVQVSHLSQRGREARAGAYDCISHSPMQESPRPRT